MGYKLFKLYNKPGAELTEIFIAIPRDVTALPTGVIFFDLNNNFDNKTGAELDQVFQELPVNVKSVHINNKAINLDEFRSKLKDKILKSLEPQLSIIEEKAKELKTRNYDNAYNAANSLHTALTNLKNQYSSGTIQYLAFKNGSMNEIKTARTELEKHRGWKDILGNVALCILGLGIGYLAICAFKGGFFKFNTDSAKKLDDLKHSIDPETPNL